MPQFNQLPYPSRYNSLRLLGYDYASIRKLCAITLVSDARRPIFADMLLAKSILTSLLHAETLAKLHLRAFTLMPDHLHLLAGISSPNLDIPNAIGGFKSFTTQLYWKRSQQIIASGKISLPSQSVLQVRVRRGSSVNAGATQWSSNVATGSCEVEEVASGSARKLC